jgi:ATP-dependent helicase HrpB
MTELPIDQSIPAVIAALARRSLVLVAPPGSGKTTRVPPALLDSGLLAPDQAGVIVLQPRRIAARSAAARIAQERGWQLGEQVGYHVRFERRYSRRTRLYFLTEGILTRRLLADPFLEHIGAVVLDEFHERSLDGDLALALLAEVRRAVRPDLIVIVMSATIDAEPVARYLDDCPIVRAPGRLHPVEIEYRPADHPASTDAIGRVIEEVAADRQRRGHVLVFLPGFAEIRRAERRIGSWAQESGRIVLPLHGSLSASEQDRALAPSDRPKIILSTNVAETSLTIDGVDTVIDSGLARSVRYDPARGIDRWELARVSRASADQRAGRAGRTGPGRCIRLWSERAHRGLPEFEQPEIERTDLCATVLALYAWGRAGPDAFPWYQAPSAEQTASAKLLLSRLGALAGDPPAITALGREMIALPVHPRLARLLIAARDVGAARAGAAIAAILSEKDLLARDGPSRYGPGTAQGTGRDRLRSRIGRSDVLERLDLLAEAERARFAPALRHTGIDPRSARQVAQARDQLLRELGRTHDRPGGANVDEDAVLKWLLLAFPDRVVKRRGAAGGGLMVGGRGARLGPDSVVREAELFLALDARTDRRNGALEAQVNIASEVREEWLEELAPESLRRERVMHFDESRGRVVAVRRLWYHDLLLREDAATSGAAEDAGHVLAQALRPEAASLIRANPQAAQWLARLEFLRTHLAELNWPDVDDAALASVLDLVCEGKTARTEVESADVVPYLQARLSHAQMRELAESAPLALTIPSGRSLRLQYEPGRPPILAVRLQELFGWSETPRLARGRVPVLLHLLAPNQRPVQITNDLRSFWTTTYHQVRKDLRARYPKHAWPEDPLHATARRGVR